jgi:hypothetical protein
MAHALLGDLDAARRAARWDYERFEPGSAEQLTGASVGALTFCFLREHEPMRELAQAVVASPPMLLGPTHVEFSKSMLLIAELREVADEAPSEARDEKAWRIAEQLFAQLQASGATGIKIGVLLQQAMIVEAALEAVQDRPSSPRVDAVLTIAREVGARAHADLESKSVLELNRYILPEARGIFAQLAARLGDTARAAAELEAASRDVDRVRERSAANPRLLEARLRARAEAARSR